MRKYSVVLLTVLLLAGCAPSRKQQRQVLNMIKGEVVRANESTCDEIRAYLYRLEIKINHALEGLE